MEIHDLHVHTVYSKDVKDTKLSFENIVCRAEEKKIAGIGFANHYHPGFNALAAEEITSSRTFVSTYRGPLSVHLGIEASILDQEGRITLTEKERLLFDYAIASLHPNFPDVTEFPVANVGKFIDFLHYLYLNITAHPLVDIIGHPWNLHAKSVYDNTRSFYGICKNILDISPAACFDKIPDSYFEEFAQAVKERNKAVELNAYGVATKEIRPLYGEDEKERNEFGASYLRFYRILAQRGVKLTVGSDAHSLDRIGDTLLLEHYLKLLGVNEEQLWWPD